jgi:hypothetical protein
VIFKKNPALFHGESSFDYGYDVLSKKKSWVEAPTILWNSSKQKKVGTPIGVPTFDSETYDINAVETPGCARATTNCC